MQSRAEISSARYVNWNRADKHGKDDCLLATGWQGALTMWNDYPERKGAADSTVQGAAAAKPPGGYGVEGIPSCWLHGHTGDVTATTVCGLYVATACSHGIVLLWQLVRLSPGQPFH